MGTLPTDRDTSDTAADHVTDHNTLHTLNNQLGSFTQSTSAPGSPTTGDLWLDTDAVPSGTSVRHGLRLRRVAAQTINSGSGTAIQWDTEDEDTDGFITATSDTITIPSGLGGVYAISAHLIANVSPSARWFMSITGNGKEWRINGSTASEDTIAGSVTVELAATQTVTVAIFQSSGSSKTFTGRMEMFKVSD